MPLSLLQSLIFLLVAFCASPTIVAFQPRNVDRPATWTTTRLSSTAARIDGGAALLKSILKKPSKVLTVGVECESELLSADEFTILSMQLRKCKVSAIWCASVDALQTICQEQESAKGDFPEPCPVIYHGPNENAKAAIEAGASAIVYTVDNALNDDEETVVLDDCEKIWKVSTLQEVDTILARTNNTAEVFWLDGVEDLQAVSSFLPTGSLCIATVDPMQPDGAEVDEGKAMKKLGCASLFIRRACVGDTEDVEYAQFLVSGLTSKASSEFKFSGLTGSTNGHFGGVQASGSVKWRRVEE